MSEPPQQRQRRWEMRAQRACLAVLLLGWFRWLSGELVHATPPHPVGVARLIDLSFLANPALQAPLQVGIILCLILYVIGIAMPVSTATLAALWTGMGALYVSQGSMGHATQLVAVVLLVQTLAYGSAAIARWTGWSDSPIAGHERAEWYSKQAIVAAYVVTGMTKLLRSSGQWALFGPNLAVQVVRTHDQVYHNTLAPGLLERGESIASSMLAHPDLMRILLGGVLIAEVGAFVALLGRRASITVGAALVAMHWGIRWTMLIRFPQHEALLLIYLMELPALAVAVMAWLRSRMARPASPSR